MQYNLPLQTRKRSAQLYASEQRSPARTNAPLDTVPYLQSVIPHNRLDFLTQTCRKALRRCPGHVLEIGVYRGGSLSRLAQVVREVCPQYRAIGIDTFAGHPYCDGHPVHPRGKYADVDLSTLKALFDKQSFAAWIELHAGRVEDILEGLSLEEVAFVHIDCDLYLPISYCAAVLPGRIHAGATLYFDDYGHEHCPGATRAVSESFSEDRLRQVFMPEDGTCWSCYLRLDDQTR